MVKYITSKDNNKLKHAASLKETKYRREYNEFLAEGKKALEMALAAGNVREVFTVKEIPGLPNDLTQYILKEDLLMTHNFLVYYNSENKTYDLSCYKHPNRPNKVSYHYWEES